MRKLQAVAAVAFLVAIVMMIAGERMAPWEQFAETIMLFFLMLMAAFDIRG